VTGGVIRSDVTFTSVSALAIWHSFRGLLGIIVDLMPTSAVINRLINVSRTRLF